MHQQNGLPFSVLKGESHMRLVRAEVLLAYSEGFIWKCLCVCLNVCVLPTLLSEPYPLDRSVSVLIELPSWPFVHTYLTSECLGLATTPLISSFLTLCPCCNTALCANKWQRVSCCSVFLCVCTWWVTAPLTETVWLSLSLVCLPANQIWRVTETHGCPGQGFTSRNKLSNTYTLTVTITVWRGWLLPPVILRYLLSFVQEVQVRFPVSVCLKSRGDRWHACSQGATHNKQFIVCTAFHDSFQKHILYAATVLKALCLFFLKI